ncbi:MAG: NAD(P)-dependent oxidoreductase [Promethearchaeota archaeon]
MKDFKIGFIGIGTMGEHMCRNIMQKGKWEMYVYDVRSSQVDKLAREGAKSCKSIKEVAENCNVIISMVPKNEHVKDIVNQLLPYIQKGTIYFDMSTISPDLSIDLSQKIKATGAVMMDVPVVKSQGAAITGNLGIYVGGDKEIYKKIRPILECMGKPDEIIYYGENGKGLAMKMCHNMLVGIIQNGVNEMILMAKAAGIDYDKIHPGIAVGGGQNFYLDVKAKSIKEENFTPKFSFRNMHKDMHLILEFAEKLGLDLQAAKRVCEIYDKGIETLGDLDFSATIKIMEKICKK